MIKYLAQTNLKKKDLFWLTIPKISAQEQLASFFLVLWQSRNMAEGCQWNCSLRGSWESERERQNTRYASKELTSDLLPPAGLHLLKDNIPLWLSVEQVTDLANQCIGSLVSWCHYSLDSANQKVSQGVSQHSVPGTMFLMMSLYHHSIFSFLLYLTMEGHGTKAASCHHSPYEAWEKKMTPLEEWELK